MTAPILNMNSPLDSLVRRTSERYVHRQVPDSRVPEILEPVNDAQGTRLFGTKKISPVAEVPPSPLLHGHFSRNSTATASSNDNNSFLHRSSLDSRNAERDPKFHQYDDEGGFPDYSAYDHQKWIMNVAEEASGARTLMAGMPLDSETVHYQPRQPTPALASPLPAVVVSSDTLSDAFPPVLTRGARVPIFKAAYSPTHLVKPAIIDDDQKRQVLERNRRRLVPSGSAKTSGEYEQGRQLSSYSAVRLPGRARSPSPSGEAHRSASLKNDFLHPDNFVSEFNPSHGQVSGHAIDSPSAGASRYDARLSSASAPSLYSTVSYYENSTPSPSGVDISHEPRAVSAASNMVNATPDQSGVNSNTPLTAQDYLQLGIQHHESSRLKESALCFEKSATENGGCGIGMLMWGLTLRHGWGCQKNEKVGFKWLRKAAECAVEDLENAREGGSVEQSAVRTELVLAIYEVGQCFFQGWGVAKDQRMAVSYYTVAAKLGDPDAQSDLAFCLANGKGCKKNRKEAAKWYRAAVAQGQSDIGLAWIYKEKYL